MFNFHFFTDFIHVLDVEEKCSVKRKSGGGGDAPDDTPAEEVSPEKKPKLKEATSEVDSKKEEVKAVA